MEFDYRNKVCVITGAGAGIGQATAVMFAKHGAIVVLNDLSLKHCADTVRMIEEANAQWHAVTGDISDPAVAHRLVNEAVEKYGKLDVLVNVAGIVQSNTIETITPEEFDRSMAINVKAPMMTCQAACRQMCKQGYGVMVVIASTAGILGVGNRMAYSTSKGALIAMCKSIAADMAHTNVRINCVCPGTVDTPSMEARFQAMPDPVEGKKKFLARELNGRIGKPEEIARTVLFAAASEIDYLNGSTIVVDGGMTCCTQ